MTVSTARPDASAPPAPRAPLGAVVALAVVLAVAATAVAMSLMLVAIPPKQLPAPLPEQNQDAETLSYLLAFAVFLPAALAVAPRLAAAMGPAIAAALAGLLVASLALAILGLRLTGALGLGDGDRAALAVALAWWLAAGVLLVAAARGRSWAALVRFQAPIRRVAALLWLAVPLCFTDLSSISPLGLALGAAGAAAAFVAFGRMAPRRPPPRWGLALDVAIGGAVLLAVPDLLIFRPEQAVGNAPIALETSVIQFHHDFLLGPANEVLGGHPMLADTASQYGVTSIYLPVAWFLVAPIGYGTLGLLCGALTALWFAAGYCVLRLAGAPRALAACALALAVVVLVFNLSYPVGSLPQSTPLRFGMPMAVILAAVAGARRPALARAARIAAWAVVGLSAVWALEAFAYTLVVFAAVICLEAWLAPAGGRLRGLARQLAGAAAAVAVAHALLAAATLLAAGRLPDWGEYLAYLREFLLGELGDLTYDVPAWSPAYPVAIAYLASAAAIVELARRRGTWADRERPALVALTGMTVYGIALLSYFVDRSLTHILLYIGLPALLTCALWLSVLLRSRRSIARPALAGGLAVAVLLLAVAWSTIGDRFPRSMLAQAAPRGESLRGSLRRLWHPPPMDARAVAGERQVARHMPGETRSLVMTTPDLGTEILIRSGRHDRLALGDPWEASFVAARHLGPLRAAVDSLRAGDRMLMDASARTVLGRLRSDPSLDPLRLTPPLLAPLQQWALERIDERFRMTPVGTRDGEFTVVELTPKA